MNSKEIISAMCHEEPLDRFLLPLKDGRTVLKGLSADSPETESASRFAGFTVERMTNIISFENVTLRSLHFTNSLLPDLQFVDCRIENCIFEESQCSGWRMWGTTTQDCLFRRSDMRDLAAGGCNQQRQLNLLQRIRFEECDLRDVPFGLTHICECHFSNCKLAGARFDGTTIVCCAFEGDLSEVRFSKHHYLDQDFPPNPMRQVDFSKSTFHFTEFRDLDLKDVQLPVGGAHIALHHFRPTLQKLSEDFRRGGVPESFSRFVSHALGISGKEQMTAVYSRQELETWHGKHLQEFLDCYREASGTT